MITEPEVGTAAGTVRGRNEHGLAVFRGIPYAQPPVGALRFAAPEPAAKWDGVRDAGRFGPRPPQPPAVGATQDVDGSDDWLTLNVWSPDLGARLPVMVYIHGGAYLHNGSDNPHSDGAVLAATGAVVVSMNYRLGFEGFAHVDGAPDNRGILDQAAALRWVQDNIDGFGGDPGNVTVFGQSAGAGSVAALLTMPTAAGLFRRAIALSVPSTFFTPELAADVSASITAELGRPATLASLVDVAPSDLVRATRSVTLSLPQREAEWGPIAHTPTPFSPVVDGDVLASAPWEALAGGAGRGVDLIAGHTRDEFSLLAYRQMEAADVTALIDGLAPGGSAAYGAAFPEADTATLYGTVMSDWLMRMPSLHLAEAHAAGRGNAWVYELGWWFGPAGASHSLDVLLLLGTLHHGDLLAAATRPDAAAEADRLGRLMRAEWLSFATTGDPGWARYADGRATRVYDADTRTLPYPEEASRRIWAGYRFGTLDLRTQ
ncbi:carboxylesterase/lipase family protein [Pseudonocardia sp. TRM90224]|uniref:carboxylesterase/lipase family protein n=1 Tax=Pseudonocardia sp. TRM90224 TaxID=2812678 RepID=UPI001E329353|nr:carboxylesterase family protein [Pseudonocardia sp. TRM90224]